MTVHRRSAAPAPAALRTRPIRMALRHPIARHQSLVTPTCDANSVDSGEDEMIPFSRTWRTVVCSVVATLMVAAGCSGNDDSVSTTIAWNPSMCDVDGIVASFAKAFAASDGQPTVARRFEASFREHARDDPNGWATECVSRPLVESVTIRFLAGADDATLRAFGGRYLPMIRRDVIRLADSLADRWLESASERDRAEASDALATLFQHPEQFADWQRRHGHSVHDGAIKLTSNEIRPLHASISDLRVTLYEKLQ